MIRIQCPGCEKLLRVDDSRAGLVGACPACKQKFRIPGRRADEPAESPAKGPHQPPEEEARPRKPTAALPRKAAREQEQAEYGFEEVSSPPPRKRRPDDEAEPPPRRRRPAEPDAFDRHDNVGKHRHEGDEEERPRRRKKKRRRGSEGFLASLDGFWWFLIGLGVFWVLFTVVTVMVPAVGIVMVLVGGGVSIVSGIGILIEAFQEGPLWGFGCLFFWPVQWIFIITFWDRCARLFFMHMAGGVVMGTGWAFWISRMLDFPP